MTFIPRALKEGVKIRDQAGVAHIEMDLGSRPIGAHYMQEGRWRTAMTNTGSTFLALPITGVTTIGR